MNENVCQCCAMPMGDSDEMYGTYADGSKNEDYCKYCYENGKLLFDGTMEEMIEVCVPHIVQANPEMNEDTARNMMSEILPTLKYWKQGNV